MTLERARKPVARASPIAADPLRRAASPKAGGSVHELHAAAARRGFGSPTAPRIGRSDEPAEREAQKFAGGSLPPRLASGSTRPAGPERAPPDLFGGLGGPLDATTRDELGRAVGGHDLGSVRIHTDGVTEAIADSLDAAAFAVGEHIGFARGRYEPRTTSGRGLIAHELAHVLQSRAQLGEHVVRRQGAGAPTRADAAAADPAQEIVLDATGWEPDEEAVISFRSGDHMFMLSGWPYVLKVPPAQAARVPRAVFGVSATGSSGSALITTGEGRGLMFDTGSGITRPGSTSVSSAIYLNQVELLSARMGGAAPTDIFISHGHTDHFNRFEETVRRYGIPAANVVIPDFHAVWAAGLTQQWQRLAQTQLGRDLGYDRIRPGSAIYDLDPSARVYRARFDRGDLVIEYRVEAEAVKKMGDTPAGKRPASKLLDTASALVRIRQQGTPFRMVVVGDLRGADIHALRVAMEKEASGSFARFFQNVEIVGGMQHHLGVVSQPNDVAGIRDLLEVTALSRGRLEVVVQTDNLQMRPRLVEALNVLGVDVTVALAGNEKKESNVTVSTGSQVTRIGAATRRFEAQPQFREAMQRVAELRQQQRLLTKYGGQLEQEKLLEKPAEALSEVTRARVAADKLYGELIEQTLGRLQQSGGPGGKATTRTMDAVQFDTAATQSRAQQILASGAAQQRLSAESGEMSLRERLDLFGRYERNEAELNLEMRNLLRTGQVSARLRELIEIVSPQFAREVLGRAPRSEREAQGQLVALGRQAQLVRAGQGAGAARPYGGSVSTGMRVGAGALAALEVVRIAGDIKSQINASQAAQKFQGYNDFLWFQQKGVLLPMAGVIDRTFRADVTYTVVDSSGRFDNGQWEAFNKNAAELNAITVGRVPDEWAWVRFGLWVDAWIRNYDDFHRHFVEGNPPVQWTGSFTDGKWSYRISTYNDWVPGGGSWSLVEDELLTRIMQRTARRVIEGTETAIERTWKNRGAPLPAPREPAVTAPGTEIPREPGVSPLENRRPTARAHFKEDAERSLLSQHPQRTILERRDWLTKDPSLLVFENEQVPAPYVLVGGGDYNTYLSILRVNAPRYVGATVYLPRNRKAWSAAEERAANDAVYDKRGTEYIRYDDHPEMPHDPIYRAEVHYLTWGPNYAAVGLVDKSELEFDRQARP